MTDEQMQQGMPQRQQEDTYYPKKPKPAFKVVTSSPKIRSLEEQETEIAEKIIQSKQPIIIITEKSAAAMAGLSKYLLDVLPNIPIVFENEIAYQTFFKQHYVDKVRTHNSCVGYFEIASNPTKAQKWKQSDCLIIFGTPKDELKSEIITEQDYFINPSEFYGTALPHINLAILSRMKLENVDIWNKWRHNLQQHSNIF